MASKSSQQYGSQPSASEIVESSTYQEYSPQCGDQPQFISFVSPESPDGTIEVTNNITGEPLGELQLGGSSLYQRRQHAKPVAVKECVRDIECNSGLEGGIETPAVNRKRIRSGPSEDSKKSKKVKVYPKDDKADEGQSGFARLNEFLSNIQYLNDGTLNFELDVSYDSFKLKVEYSFE